MTDDTVVEFTGEWHGADENTPEPTEAEIQQAMDEIDFERLNSMVVSVLEYLTVRAVVDAPYYILTDDEKAIALFAADDDVKAVLSMLPDNFKCMNDEINDFIENDEVVDFITNADPGDEQPDEPAS